MTPPHVSTACGIDRSGNKRREREPNISSEEPGFRIGHWHFDIEEGPEASCDLPEPDEEKGMGDILEGIAEDPDADPVEEVREIRR